jgi:ribosomal protein S16
MRKKLVIKIFRTSAKSHDITPKVIVVGYNLSKVNGRYIEKIGHYSRFEDGFFYFIKFDRLAYWLNRGAYLKSRVSWVVGLIGNVSLKKKNDSK